MRFPDLMKLSMLEVERGQSLYLADQGRFQNLTHIEGNGRITNQDRDLLIIAIMEELRMNILYVLKLQLLKSHKLASSQSLLPLEYQRLPQLSQNL